MATRAYASKYQDGRHTAARWLIMPLSAEHHHAVDLTDNHPHWNSSWTAGRRPDRPGRD